MAGISASHFSLSEISDSVLAGICRGFNAYARWTNKRANPWYAAEHVSVIHVAQRLSTRFPKHQLWCEYSARDAIRQGGERRGAFPKVLSAKARVDLALFDATGKPKVVIELKRNPGGFADIEKDVKRLRTFVRASGSIRTGILGFMMHTPVDGRGAGRTGLISRLGQLKKESQTVVGDLRVNSKMSKSGRYRAVHNDREYIWVSACLIFKEEGRW